MNQETKDRVIAKFKQRIAEMKQKREERDRNQLDMISSRPHLGELNNDDESIANEGK